MASPLTLLKRVPFLAALHDAQLRLLVGIGEALHMVRGRDVFVAGAVGDAMYLVIDGRVRVADTEVGTGAHFGETSLIDGLPRPHDATAATDCKLLIFRRVAFLAQLAGNATLLGDVLAGVGRQSQAELARHKSITQMLAGVAHDVNTPLGIINQAASIIAEKVREKTIAALAKDADAQEELEDVAEAAQLILTSSARAIKLVTTFKDAAAMRLSDQREVVDIVALLRETVGLFRFKARARNLDIHIEALTADDDRKWNGYPGHFSQIVLNLLSNIDRYAYPDGQGGRVDISVEAGAHHFTLQVEDHGVGMSAKHLAQVFTPLFTTGHSKGGTGLGMAIVHQLVTSTFGGTIELHSTLGKGTRIVLCLPRTVSHRTQEEPTA